MVGQAAEEGIRPLLLIHPSTFTIPEPELRRGMILGITLGDVTGIGPEVALRAVARLTAEDTDVPVPY